ncbi:hypothetical protein Emag_000735 [Eimeria magna]
MRILAVFWGAICVALAWGRGASSSPRFLARQAAFVSSLPSCGSGSISPAVLRSPSSLVLTGPTAAATAAAAAEKGPRCYSYPLTFGGGPRGGGEGEGRVALVTGASRGIGLAIAQTLAKGGVETVLCVARDQAACDAAASEVRGLGAASEGFGVDVSDGQANYAASKAGLIGFTKSLAKEYAGRNITVNAIAPGFIKSAMTDRMTDAAKAATLASVPAGRLGNPQEVADLAAFLASDQSAYINGKVIPIDGAMLFGAN